MTLAVKVALNPNTTNQLKMVYNPGLNHSLIHHFEAVPNSKKLQTTTEMWLLQAISSFPTMFLLNQVIVPHFPIFLTCCFLSAAELEERKVGILGKGLKK